VEKYALGAKEAVVRQLVKYQAELLDETFQEAENHFEHAGESQPFVIGPIVSLIFFLGGHLTHDVASGPFKNDYDWLQTRLAFAFTDQVREVFSEDAVEPDHVKIILFHDDLSMQNILVGEEGSLAAVIDWECVSALPAQRACQFPQLLEGRAQEDEPLRTRQSLRL
jgi:thiamine kinase-like enzyme